MNDTDSTVGESRKAAQHRTNMNPAPQRENPPAPLGRRERRKLEEPYLAGPTAEEDRYTVFDLVLARAPWEVER